MATEKQIEANRRNAQLSTGPRTAEGKARVAQNAIKHGLRAERMILPGEDRGEFEQFRDELWASLAPQDALEESLAAVLVANVWRLRRTRALEAALYQRGYQELLVGRARREARRYEMRSKRQVLADLVKAQLAELRAHEDAEKSFAGAPAKLDDPTLDLTRVLETFERPLSILARYEIAFSRSLIGMFHEFERVQGRRAGQPVPAPAVVDVNVEFHQSGSVNASEVRMTEVKRS